MNGTARNAAHGHGAGGADAEIVVIRPDETMATKQGLPIFQGISGQNAGARHICMNKVIIPAGAGLSGERVTMARVHARCHRHEAGTFWLSRLRKDRACAIGIASLGSF